MTEEKEPTYCLISIVLNDRWNYSVRDLVIPSDTTLDLLDSVIHRLFGWGRDHLASFFFGHPYRGRNVCDLENDDGFYDFKDVTVQQAFNKAGKTFSYVYDYGDDHTHYITLKKKKYKPEPGQYPIYCVKAEGPRGYSDDDGASDDDELLLAQHGLETEDLFDDYGNPKKKYYELRAEFTTPMEIINGGLAAICEKHKLNKIEAPAQKTAKKSAGAKPKPKFGKYCVISVTLNEGKTPSLREIALPAGIKLSLLKDIITIVFGWTKDHWTDRDECRIRAYFLGCTPAAPAVCEQFFEDCDYSMDALTLREALEISEGTLTYVFCQKFKHIHLIKLENADYEPKPGQYPFCCLKTEGRMGDIPHDRAADRRLSEDFCDFMDDNFEWKIRDFLAAHQEPADKPRKNKAKPVPSPESLNEELAAFCYSHRFKPIKADSGAVSDPGTAKAKAAKRKGKSADA